jgi:threonine synthase
MMFTSTKFTSTRGQTPATSLSAAIAAGLAPDGGLYVPQTLPRFAPEDFADCGTLAQTAARLLAPFFADDALAPQLDAICAEAFIFAAPMRALATPQDFVLELFHGPTAAFKDFGARFLAACMRRLPRESDKDLTILVATSGDTGAAVGAAFAGVAGFRVVILYPDGRVSPRQAHQLGGFGGNVAALRVAGSFDDCQRLVKQAFADAELRTRTPLSSANSISLGRLLPQMTYYAHAALAHWREHRQPLNFVVPTGNLGNALACMLARAIGLPIGGIALATNANRTLPDFFDGAPYAPRDSIATLANAMDVGAPSNFERLRWLYPDDAELRRAFRVAAFDDDAIRTTIRQRHARFGEVFCPHTATAIAMLERMRRDGASGDWAVAATAHPAKFEGIVEPLIERPVPVPPALAELLRRPSHAEPLANDYAALRRRLLRENKTGSGSLINPDTAPTSPFDQ